MLIFDLFAGTKSATQAFEDSGHKVISFELDKSFDVTEHCDVFNLTKDYLLNKYGQPDFIWASPPCTAFSVASIGHHWDNSSGIPQPRTPEAANNQLLVAYTRLLLEQLNPRFGWLIENPRGMLRKLSPVIGLERRTVTYCQYGDTRMKPTDLWGTVPGWTPRKPCKAGDSCHEAAPRGSRTGTQGLAGAKIRSMIPYELGKEILTTLERKEK